MNIRKHYLFQGDVQGVGFRYRAQQAADLLGITGWVRNNWDGSVEMEAQGPEEALDRQIQCIANGLYVDIRERQEWQLPVNFSESGFNVRDEW